MFLGSLGKLGNCYNLTIGPNSSLDLDVILTRNLLIMSQTRYHCATKYGSSQLHNRDLWIFVILLAARCHFGPIKNLSRNNHFHWEISDWLGWCAFASEKEIKAHCFSAIFLAKIWKLKCDKNKMLFRVPMKSLEKNVLLSWFTGHQVQNVDCECVIRVLAELHSWKEFLGALANLGNCYNWPIWQKSSLDRDVIWIRNLLIWRQGRYHWATKSVNWHLHNRDLWIFVILLAGRCHFVPTKTLSRNNQFERQPSGWLSWCAFASEREIKAH